jgi:DNA-directed RNA polymerase specialized sigma24 family protein
VPRFFRLPGSKPTDDQEALRVALERLPLELQQFLRLRFIERHRLEETAAMLGLSKQGAQERQAMALTALRDELGNATR